MEVVVTRYYNIQRSLLSFIGLWPFQNKIVRQIQSFFMHILFTSSILVQIFKLITSESSIGLFINVSTYAIICIAYMSKYITFVSQLQNIKHLIIRLCHNWDVLIDEKEYEIMDKYALKGKRFTFVCLSMKLRPLLLKYSDSHKSFVACISVVILVIWTTSLILFDIIAPLNGSHYVQPPFLAEYFVDEEVYFYYILTHMYIIFFVGVAVVIASEIFYATCVIHACGLFYMAGYRFEQVFDESILSLFPCTKKSSEMSEKVVRAIEAHNNAIQFVKQ